LKKTIIKERPREQSVYDAARVQGLSHIQADILCRRNVLLDDNGKTFFDPKLREIPAPHLLKNCELAVERIFTAIEKGENVGLVTDYDVDGLAAHAVAKKAFSDCFQFDNDHLHSFVGNRLQDGYGLTDQLCARILAHTPPVSLVITADCGVSDEKRLSALKQAGIDVIVTDHHLVPEDEFPYSAFALVNPQQRDCSYPDKAISGCMVCWLVLSAVRSTLLERGVISPQTPTLISLLDYVALATIADSVSLLSLTNRAVVKYGLRQINLFSRDCWKVMQFGSRPVSHLTEEDMAYQISPRINGAGRMGDPQLALDFLLADCYKSADETFKKLSEINQLRKKHEVISMGLAHELVSLKGANDEGIVVYHPDFHPGIAGIIASRLAECYGIPVVVFSATALQGILAGSCRTGGASTVHIRNVLTQTAEMEKLSGQENIISFGGHKSAAGIKIHQKGLEQFRIFFLDAIGGNAGEGEDYKIIETDGSLPHEEISLATVDEIGSLAPFGQHFEHPVFLNKFTVESAKFVGMDEDHLQLTLRMNTSQYRGIWFRARTKNKEVAEATVAGSQINCAYQLSSNEFRGKRSLQLCISEVKKENI
jgi:single-stranded-DNA-specific exonuclease